MRRTLVILCLFGLLLLLPFLSASSPRQMLRQVGYHETGRVFGSPGSARRPLPREQLPIYYETGAGLASQRQGTAFAIAATGGWATAAHVTDRCSHFHFTVNQGQSPPAQTYLRMAGKDVSVIDGGLTAPRGFDLQSHPLPANAAAYAMGFPMGRPSVVGTRLLGKTDAVRQNGVSEQVLVWVQDWRTPDLGEALDGLSGGPVLDDRGEVAGVVSMANERRGRILTSMPDVLRRLIAGAGDDVRPPAEEVIANRQNAISQFQAFLRQGMIREVICYIR